MLHSPRLRALLALLAALLGIVATGSPARADSLPVPQDLTMTPVGTVLRIGGPGLVKITLTFSVRVIDNATGAPAVGTEILFTQKNPAAGMSGHPAMDPNYVPPVEVCHALVDATGYATCAGTAKTSDLVTLLTTKSYANYLAFQVYRSVSLPLLTFG